MSQKKVTRRHGDTEKFLPWRTCRTCRDFAAKNAKDAKFFNAEGRRSREAEGYRALKPCRFPGKGAIAPRTSRPLVREAGELRWGEHPVQAAFEGQRPRRPPFEGRAFAGLRCGIAARPRCGIAAGPRCGTAILFSVSPFLGNLRVRRKQR